MSSRSRAIPPRSPRSDAAEPIGAGPGAFARTWVVVPAFSEGAMIAPVVKSLVAAFPNVVVVDDGSADDTSMAALRAGAVVLRHPVNLGQGAALQTGITFALSRGADYIATFDADGQHHASDLSRMLEVLGGNRLDIVLGSRFLGTTENLPVIRRLVLKTAVWFTNLTSGLRLTDTHNGLRVMTAEAARQLRIVQDRMAHASEIINQVAKLNLKYREVPTTVSYSTYSRNKGQRLGGVFRILTDLTLARLVR
jgi:glycosyltransferase involved in cell wall biosynthesis